MFEDGGEKVHFPVEIHDTEDADTSENLRHTHMCQVLCENLRHTHIMLTMCQVLFEVSINPFNPHNHPRERKLRFSEVR